MRASIGGVSLINIFIVFFIIVFFLLTGVVMYYKGYKVNSKIIDAIEKFEGYNEFSGEEINRLLTSYGYKRSGNKSGCIVYPNGTSGYCENGNERFDFKLTCERDTKADANHSQPINKRYIKYTVTTYIFIDLPLGLGTIKLPITTRSNPIYQFVSSNSAGC